MARIRTIKPEFWTSEQVMECDPLSRLLFIGIWNFCDDAGNHPMSEKTLKALVFPADDIDSTTIRRLIDDLSTNGLLSLYTHSGKPYLHVNGWHHQKIEKPTIKHPAFQVEQAKNNDSNEGMRPSAPVVDDQSANDQLPVDDHSATEGIGKGKVKEQEQEHGEAAASASTTHLVEFDGVDFKVSAHLITKWEQAFPAVNVELEIERAAVWAISNPNRAKKDWRKFLSNWLSKASPATVPEGTCPVDKIIDLYHQSCPNLPAVSVAGDKALRSMIVERWNESPAHQSGQNFWQPFFLKANRRSQVFYRGQNVVPRLEALVSRAVFREIAEAAA